MRIPGLEFLSCIELNVFTERRIYADDDWCIFIDECTNLMDQSKIKYDY